MDKIIIDADPGVDDAFAILLGGMSKNFDLLGITIVAGNCGLKNGIRNTFKILNMCARDDVSVYSGAKKSLTGRKVKAAYVHGKNGFGNLKYVPIKRKVSGDAIDFLINTVNMYPNEISIAACGPLTNIALAIEKDNNFAKNLKSLIIMGGSLENGNVTKHAEFNFYQDPDAAKIVFDSNIKEIVMLGLNVTEKLPLKEEYEESFKNSDNELVNTLYKITRMGAAFERSCGLEGAILNDPLTLAYLINKDVVKLKKADVNIITSGEMIGKSEINLKDDGRHKVAYDVNPELFYEILFNVILKDQQIVN